jgi:hypothetical protein
MKPSTRWSLPEHNRNGNISKAACHYFILGDYTSYAVVRVIKSRRMRCAGHVAGLVEGRGVYGVLVWKPEGKRPLGRPRLKWEDNIKMDF